MRGIFILLLILNIGLTGVHAASLKLVKTIGDDRDDYTFFILTGAAMSGKKDIYVLDGKGFFVAVYDWKGTFIRRTGQKGQGPTDFYYPRSLSIYKGKLILLDKGNRRIALSGLDLEKFDYFQMPKDHVFENHITVLKNGMFFGNFTDFREGRGRLGIINRYGDLEHSFFNEFPIEMEFDSKKVTEAENFQWLFKKRVISDECIPDFAVDEKRERLLVSFRSPDNPIRFFIYTVAGKKIKEFSYPIPDKRYRFSDFLLNATLEDIRNPKKYPAKSFRPFIYRLFIHKGHYIVNLWLEDRRRNELVRRRGFCLVFNEAGALKGKLALGGAMRFFSISPGGYILAGAFDEEITKLYIYKLVID